MKTTLLTFCLLSLSILSGCSPSSCDDSKSTDQWHDCSGTFIEKGVGTYSGEWKHGDWNGKGTFENINGDKYVGDWKNGEETGYGTYYWHSGGSKYGRWEKGNYVGKY
mgnify:CR=1 FL=1